MNEKSKIACALAMLFLTAAVIAQENSLNGRWTATLKKGDRTGIAILILSVSSNEVSGTLSDPSGQIWQIQNGKLEADQLTFDVTAREHGGTKNIHFFGQVGEDEITLKNESGGRPGQTTTYRRAKD